jgi:hypothetical protein
VSSGDAAIGVEARLSQNGRKFARQPAAQRSRPTWISAGQHSAQRFGTPKMPGEPKRVQPSKDTDLKKKS